MKINFVGNTSNLHYRIAKNLIKVGVDAHLYYNEKSDPQNFPYWDEPGLLNNLPDWIHPYSKKDLGNHSLYELTASFKEKLNNCDILHVEGKGVFFAGQMDKPFVWDPYGWDLQFYPFYSYWQKYWNIGFHPEYFIAPLLFRRSIQKCSAVVYGLWYQFLKSSYYLIHNIVGKERFIHSIPMSVDTELFSPNKNKTAQELIKEWNINYKAKGLIIYHPTRIMFTEDSYLNKGNDRLFNALAEYKKIGHDFTLILGEREIPDEQVARRMFKNLGIEENILWLPKMECHKLVEWFRVSDLCADQFVGGALGLISFEAMACGKPTLSFMRLSSKDDSFWSPEEVYEKLPPIINVSTEQEIFDALIYYTGNKSERENIGIKSREWVKEHVSAKVIAHKYLKLYKNILSNENEYFSRPRKTPLNSIMLNAEKSKIIECLDKNNIAEAKDLLVQTLDSFPNDEELIIYMTFFTILSCEKFRNVFRRPKSYIKKALRDLSKVLEMLQHAEKLSSENKRIIFVINHYKNRRLAIILFKIINFRKGLKWIIKNIHYKITNV